MIVIVLAALSAAGSPYTMEIIDAADVEASGDGLETAEVNRRATFNVDVGRNGTSRDLKVQIRCAYTPLYVHTHTHTHTQPFTGPLSGNTRVSRYHKGKTNLDFAVARDSERQWHQLGHMQI